MARRFTTGFELGAINEHNGAFVSSQYLGGVQASAARTGGYGWSCSLATAGYAYFSQIFLDHPTELYARIAIRPVSYAAASSNRIGFIGFYEGTTPHIGIAIQQPTLELKAIREGTGGLGNNAGTVLASGSIPLTINNWYVIEIYIKIDAVNGQVIVKVNGNTDISFTGNTQAAAGAAYIDIVRVGIACDIQTPNNPGIDIDDVAINDTIGGFQNSWPGRGGVYLLRPNLDGASSQWTPSTGIDHYALVDEVPANSTDYVYDEVSGHLDLYGLTDLPTDVHLVDLIEPIAIAALAEAGWNQITHVIRHGGVNYDNATHQIVNVHPTYQVYKGDPVYEVLGGTGAWSPAQVNALESGEKIT